jgi:glycine oxidase
VGLRPASEDGLPILDQTANHCWVATGHYKNGILLGPGTAKAMSQWMTGAQPAVDLAPFAMGRFAVAHHAGPRERKPAPVDVFPPQF